MGNENIDFKKGLEGVIAALSKICDVDGINGNLSYYGYSIFDLAEQATYEEVAYLLLYGNLPAQKELDGFSARIKSFQKYDSTIISIFKELHSGTHPMKALQIAYALLGGVWDSSAKNNNVIETLIAYIAQTPLLIASYYRITNKQELIEPDKSLNFAGNFLYTLIGKKPSKDHEKIFNTILILHMEHGFNASTFTARVVASTLAPISCALSGATGSLYGPLHGGANEEVLKMLDEIGSPENVEKWIDTAIEQKRKISGMGHREYKVKDPRATVLQKSLHQFANDNRTKNRLAIAEKLESYFVKKMTEKGKKIYPNVDFYSGILLSSLGIPPILFTPIFALARVSGWSAHIREQWEDNRIFRPESVYIGEENKEYIPISER